MNDETLIPRLERLVKLATEQYMNDGGIVTVLGVYGPVIEAVERPLLQTVLDRFEGNQTATARVLGINRNTLRKKMRLHGLLKR